MFMFKFTSPSRIGSNGTFRRSKQTPSSRSLRCLLMSFLMGFLSFAVQAGIAQTSPGSLPKSTLSSPLRIKDARGKIVELPHLPKRIISLAPSLTEIVFALERGNALVADTLSCDYPEAARTLPHINPLNPDREKIEIHAPDLVLAQLKLNSNKLIETLERDRIPVLVVGADSLDETYEAIRMIGEATGSASTATKISRSLRLQIQSVERRVSAARHRPTVLMMYGYNPIYTTGPDSFISQVIRSAGGENVIKEPLPNSQVSAEKVLLLKPENIICDRSMVDRIKVLPGWNVVPAVRDNRFFQSSSRTTLVRPGPRLGIAVEELAKFLHPDLFH